MTTWDRCTNWHFSGDHPLVAEDYAGIHSAPIRVSATAAAYVRGMWAGQRMLVIGRRLFVLTNGWEGRSTAADTLARRTDPNRRAGTQRRRTTERRRSLRPGDLGTRSPMAFGR
ncbi:hypothetical protein ACGFI9_35425 [Micromonospora sp. NPDC048930]|uniref:hypothetical protein n=1 Tax=Micromonospora sp. NPDC048930 TaxID=3364261 RepID=UPI0037165625